MYKVARELETPMPLLTDNSKQANTVWKSDIK